MSPLCLNQIQEKKDEYDDFKRRHDHFFEKLDLKNVTVVGHSIGGGEVVRYIGRHGNKRVAKAVLIGAVPPMMLKSDKNPGGLPLSVFDELRAGVANNRAQFFLDLSIPFYGHNKPDAKPSEAVRGAFVSQSIVASYDCIKAFSETDFTEDLRGSRCQPLFSTGMRIRSFLSQIPRCFPQRSSRTQL